MTALARRTTDWMDQHFDAERGLLWNPPRSFADDLPAHSIHIVPQNSWYVLGLLQRNGPGDVDRAAAIVDALVALQYDEPGTPWHGTYARFAETPPPSEGAVEFEDYDPNWRQFIGTALSVALRNHHDVLPERTRSAIESTVQVATDTEGPDRVPAQYTNIALKKAWMDVQFGDAERGEALAAEVVDHFDRSGAFFEFNSPTYYGIDLWGLALWRGHSSSARLREWGARLEAALWRSAASYYHAGLRNFAGPYTRAYGLDMHRYLGQVGLWIWGAVGEEYAPVPDFDASFSHSHDVCFGPCPAAVGVVVPDDATPHFRSFQGERTVETEIAGGRRGRTATAWLADDVMVGGEAGGWDMNDWDQFVAGTVHWRRPDGTIGVLRVRQPHLPGVRAEPATLRITGDCRVLDGDVELGTGRHERPGLTVDIRRFGDETVVAVG